MPILMRSISVRRKLPNARFNLAKRQLRSVIMYTAPSIHLSQRKGARHVDLKSEIPLEAILKD